MQLLKLFCCLDVYLKLYLRLKFLGFHNHFFHKLYVLLRFSCLICMVFVWSGFMDNYFILSKHGDTQPGTESIIDERADHSDEGFDVEELMRNVAPNVLLQRINKSFNNFEMLDKVSRDLLYEECKACDKEHTVLWMTLELMKLKWMGH
jgi:hypothetical protein